MVDVSGKDVTARQARATGRVLLSAGGGRRAAGRGGAQGRRAGGGRIAGIQGAKRTPDLVPLCHPIALHAVAVDLTGGRRRGAHHGDRAHRRPHRRGDGGADLGRGRPRLALIDMVKAVDPAAVISDVRVEEKTGGKTGTWRRP